MELTIQTTGKPAQVRAEVQKSVAAARQKNDAIAPIAGAIQDALGARMAGLSADDVVTVDVKISVTARSETAAIQSALESAAKAAAARVPTASKLTNSEMGLANVAGSNEAPRPVAVPAAQIVPVVPVSAEGGAAVMPSKG